MRLRLFPRDARFFDLFTQSALNAVEGAKRYRDMLENYSDPKGAVKEIRDLEHRGDELTHETINKLNTTFVTPIDREDIHALSTSIDDIMDFIEAGADMYGLHRIEHPTQFAKEQAEVLVRICESTASAMGELRRFKNLERYWMEINTIENEGDQVYRRAIADLFNGDHKAMDVLKWKEIYDQIEAAIDVCEDVANRLEAIVLKHA